MVLAPWQVICVGNFDGLIETLGLELKKQAVSQPSVLGILIYLNT